MSSLIPPPSVTTHPKNHNKFGKNQYKDRPLPDDPHVAAILQAYHRKGINDKQQISKLLLEEHGITLSDSSISRRRRKLGLCAGRLTTLKMSDDQKRQLILDQMAKDPSGKTGPRTVKVRIFEDHGVHLTRDYIRDEMMKLDPVSYCSRGPAHAKIKRRLRDQRLALAASTSTSAQHTCLPASQAPLASGSGSNGSAAAGPSRPTGMNMDDDEYSDSDTPDNNRSYYNAPQPDTQPLHPNPLHDTPPTDVSHTRLITSSSTFSTLPCPPTSTSSSMAPALTLLQNTIPKMEALTRFLNAIDTTLTAGGQELDMDQTAYEAFVNGMEKAALLERQLSRAVSRIQVPRS